MRRRQSSRYRLVVLVAICLAAGAVVNVGVAWVGPIWQWESRRDTTWRVTLGPGEWPDAAPVGWPAMGDPIIGSSWCRTFFVGSSDFWPGKTFKPPNSAVAEEITTMMVVDSGWPMRSLTKTDVSPWPPASIVQCGIRAQIGSWSVELPIRPLPLGFIVNTVFYAVPLAVLGAGWTKLVRSRRRRDGRCIACGYSRVGIGVDSPCPECGRAP